MSLNIEMNQYCQHFLDFNYQVFDARSGTSNFSLKFSAIVKRVVESSMEEFISVITEKYDFEYRDE